MPSPKCNPSSQDGPPRLRRDCNQATTVPLRQRDIQVSCLFGHLLDIAGCELVEGIMMEENAARLRARRQNIDHYIRLLRTNLSDVERDFIKRRIAEERSERQTTDFDNLSGER